MNCPIRGHDEIVQCFSRSLARGRLGSGYLFVGPPGVGKRSFGIWLASAWLCESTSDDQLDACGSCPACQQVVAGSHPDFEIVSKPPDKSTIPVDLLIGDKQHRMREGLCARIAMSPARGGRKIAIIDDADFLSQESANCLLKTLEEPPPRATLILIGTSAERQLPTIRSRCQLVTFQPLPLELTHELIMANRIADNDVDASRLAALSGGSLARAAELNDPDIWQFRDEFHQTLVREDWMPLATAKFVAQFVDAAGKDAPSRRVRLKQVIEMALQLYRDTLMVNATGSQTRNDQGSAQQLSHFWPHGQEALASCVDRCLTALIHVAANANQATHIETWIDDLWQLHRHGVRAAKYEYAI